MTVIEGAAAEGAAAEDTDVEDRAVDRIRAAFADPLVPTARAGLPAMLVDDGAAFCFRAGDDGAGGLRLEGRSERYGAMALVGLARHAARGGAGSGSSSRGGVPLDAPRVLEALVAWAPGAAELGDAALVLWLCALREDAQAEALAARIVARRVELFDPRGGFPSMERGFLLIGLAEAVRAGVEVPGLRELARDVAGRLAENRDPETDLFAFDRRVLRRNVHRARTDARLGSFASQVYPTMGFAAWARAAGDGDAAQIAVRCASRLCDLQGPEGQWWWVYQSRRRARAAVRYPVYTVHQDAMGPMALCAAALADGGSRRFDVAIARSLAWFESRKECADERLVERGRGVVWRAVQRDDPARTGRLGLGAGELRRMGVRAWTGAADTRAWSGGFVCRECRPYHLGWVLLADAMFEELVSSRVPSRGGAAGER